MPVAYILLLVAGLFMTGTLSAQDLSGLDAEISRYETLCEDCLNLKVRMDAGERISRQEARDMVGRFVAMNASLKERRMEMTAAQRKRFDDIGIWFSTGQRPSLSVYPMPELEDIRPCPYRVSSDAASTSLSLPEYPLKRFRRWDYLDKCVLTDFSTLDLSHGFMLGLHGRRWGGYLRARFNNTIRGVPGGSYECLSDGTLSENGRRFWGTGESEIYAMNFTGGVLLPTLKWLVFYVGAGYGEYYIVWEDVEGNWAHVSDSSYHGVALDLGAVFSWRWLAVSAGVNALDFRKLSFTCGVGVYF